MKKGGEGFHGQVGLGTRPDVLVVDLIRAFTDPQNPLGSDLHSEVMATRRLLDTTRDLGLPIFFTTTAYHPGLRDAGLFPLKVPALEVLLHGSEAVEIDPRLGLQPGEMVVEKKYASAFFGTALAAELTALGVDTLILCGATTSGCIRASVVDALQHGFRPIVPEECVGDRNPEAHRANLLDIEAKYGDVVSLDQLLAWLAPSERPAGNDGATTIQELSCREADCLSQAREGVEGGPSGEFRPNGRTDPGRAPSHVTSLEQPISPYPDQVRVIDVGPRDGLQMETQWVPTEKKVEILQALIDAGVKEIEATSFVHPKAIPQMRDAAKVMEAAHRLKGSEGVHWSALVPNLKGAERALAVGVDEVRLVVCATESYNQRNVGLTIAESEALFGEIGEAAAARGVAATVIFGVALGCPLEGEVPAERVARLAERFLARGATAIGIADSYGLANPRQVRHALRTILPVVGETPAWLHLHDTRGMAMANATVAMEEGITAFDTAFGGLGGTPILKGASGNIPTEDFLYLCQEMGIETDIDLDGIRALSRSMEAFFDRRLPSHVLHAGTREELMALNRSED